MSKHLAAISNYKMEEYDKAKLRALVLGYFYRYAADTWYAVDVERNFEIELKVKPYVFVGKIDTLITDDNHGLVMLEHKTTVNDLGDLNKPYFKKLAYDLQLSAYHMAQLFMEEELEQTIYDVVHKPRIRPRKLKKADIEELQVGHYCNLVLHDPIPALDVGDVETPGMYEARLFSEILADPDKYYLRHGNLRRTTAQCEETYLTLNTIADHIRDARVNGSWYQNSSACSKFNTPCEYINICCGTSRPDDGSWRERKGSDLSGEFNLSTSGIHTFMECRRKYYYRYVERIERDREEQPLALTFGSAFHECLESFWNSTKKEEVHEQSIS